jgi:hypothetical protein
MFKPVEYNLDMRDPNSWHEVCRNQPKDVIAYIPAANLHEQELLDGATSIGKLYSPRNAALMFTLNTRTIQALVVLQMKRQRRKVCWIIS